MESRLEVFTGNANPNLAREISKHLGYHWATPGSVPLAMGKYR
jgi:hypothetical protein